MVPNAIISPEKGKEIRDLSITEINNKLVFNSYTEAYNWAKKIAPELKYADIRNYLLLGENMSKTFGPGYKRLKASGLKFQYCNNNVSSISNNYKVCSQ